MAKTSDVKPSPSLTHLWN